VNLDQGGADRRRATIRPPPRDLADRVESSFVLSAAGARPDRPTPWRVVPEASANVVIVVPDDGSAPRAALVGARSIYADIDRSGRRWTIGIRLRPGGLSALAREHAANFTDTGFPLEDVLGASWRDLTARAAEEPPEAVLEAAFALLRQRPRDPRGTALFAAAQGASSVAEIADALAVSTRTLHDRSCEAVGLAPKRLLRILRLQRALEALAVSVGWADVAAQAGFADQPHLVREMRELLGETPKQWAARAQIASDSFKTVPSRAA
jgi:AraC-like DNA-binding protein